MPTDISTAIAATHPNPSPAQREAGNYRKGKVRLHGLLISIENPKGTRRKPEWKPLAAHYGYLNRTEGKDGDHVDVYLGPNLRSELVFVIDQVTESGKRFDEHKCVLGCISKAQAKRLYLANYPASWRCGPITAMTIEQFKTWLAKGDTTRRASEQVSRYDKRQGIGRSADMNAPAGPSPKIATGPAATYDERKQHQVGETKMGASGQMLRLGENHRWQLANPDEPNSSSPTPGGPGEADPNNPAANAQPQPGDGSQPPPPGADGQPPGEPPAPPSPANDQATRNSFVASRLSTVHPEIGGLIRAIHESPSYQSSGEYVSFDVHKRVAADLHSTLTKHAGKEMAGGNVVDLGQGRVGFASEAGSIVVWPADETGRHQISYTNKTGIVGRAMAAGGSQSQGNSQGGENGNAQPSQPLGTVESPFEAEEVGGGGSGEQEPEAPPLPSEVAARGQQQGAGQQQRQQYPGGGESPFRQPGQQRGGQQQPPTGGKLPDEQAYDDSLTAPKERPAHVLLRRRANTSKENFRAAFDNYEQAVHDRERPDRIRKLKKHAVHLREIYNEHHRQATRAEGEHRGRLKESGKATKERMKALGIGPYKPKPKAEKPAKLPKEPKPAKLPKEKQPGAGKSAPAPAPTPLLDQAEKNPGAGDSPGNVPTASPEALAAAKEMGKLPKQAQLAGSAAQTYLKHSGLSVTPENHKVLQHAIRQGWVKDKKELRTLLKRAAQIHSKNSAASEAKGTGATNDHDALREAVRRKGNRERRESWAKIVKEQASAWDMTPQEYHETASGVYREFVAPLQERESVKDSMRKMVGTNARKLRQIEERGGKGGKGGDYSNVKGLDSAAEYLQEHYPHLVENENAEETAWNMIKEGRKQVPGKTSQEFTDHMGEFLQNGMGFGGGGDGEGGMSPEELAEIERQNAETGFGDEDDSQGAGTRGGQSMVPFAKLRAGAVRRYRKWRASLLN